MESRRKFTPLQLNRDTPVYFRLTRDEHDHLQREAASKGLRMSEWLRAVVLQKLGREAKI
jgi:hypothetical protein